MAPELIEFQIDERSLKTTQTPGQKERETSTILGPFYLLRAQQQQSSEDDPTSFVI